MTSPVKKRLGFPTGSGRNGHNEPVRRHRYQSFTQRIAKLNIDPVRRVRRYDLDSADVTLTTASYFHDAVHEWKDLNTSENFVDFARAIVPLCDSLPQVLHFEDKIADLLAQYIEKKDALSLEPLLALVAHFAHDLGVRFEKHFARLVALVTSVASKHEDVGVIEWSFTCLAWLFKYLSRLLVPDLRPVYDLMAPLLGKCRQKSFVIRFAAEALSFLIRRAGQIFHKDRNPLDIIIRHIFEDFQTSIDSKHVTAFRQGLMGLFAEAIKGINHGVYSSGSTILHCMLYMYVEHNLAVEELISGVIINIIHHTEAETFAPIIDEVLGFANEVEADNHKVRFAGNLLFVVVGVRKGSRVAQWQPLVQACHRLLSLVARGHDHANEALLQIGIAIAVIIQAAPIDAFLSSYKQTLETIMEDGNLFLAFCDSCAALDAERFRQFIRPFLLRFIVNRWDESEQALCTLVQRLGAAGVLVDASQSSDLLPCPDAWQERIATIFDDLAPLYHPGAVDEDRWNTMLPRCQSYLDLSRQMALRPSVRSRISARLGQIFSRLNSADTAENLSSEQARFAAGPGFLHHVLFAADGDDLGIDIWTTIRVCGAQYANLPSFLDGLLLYLDKITNGASVSLDIQAMELLQTALFDNLFSPSHEIRLATLQILQSLHKAAHSGKESETLTLALLIEEAPLTLQTARVISMHVRKLAASYTSMTSDPWLEKIVPRFCFGLLGYKMSQVWEDACAALQVIVQTKEGEEYVAELAFRWLESPISRQSAKARSSRPAMPHVSCTPFQSKGILHLDSIFEKSQEISTASHADRYKDIEKVLQTIPDRPDSARAQALRVLCGVPQLAEKRSRVLVPMFLEWATHDDEPHGDVEPSVCGAEDPQSTHDVSSHWARNDQKAFLALLGKFQNPKALFKSAEVYSALLELLSSGDIDIQKPTLEAILKWRLPSINMYEENLRNLLDDDRFKEEVTRFVQVGVTDQEVQPEHRKELMPVLLRMLYGRIIARKGTASGKRGMSSKRKIVMKALADTSDEELRAFILIALGPLGTLTLSQLEIEPVDGRSEPVMNVRRQVGAMNMMEDLLNQLGGRLEPFAKELIVATIYCTLGAAREIITSTGPGSEGAEEKTNMSLLRNIRGTGYRCLDLLFRHCEQFDWESYQPIISKELVGPRLELLPIETSQAPSGILQLLSTWTTSARTVFYLADFGNTILTKISDCLTVPSAKEEVKLSVLALLRNIVDLFDSEDVSSVTKNRIRTDLLQPHVNNLLIRLGGVLREGPSKELLEPAVELVYRLAVFVTDASEARKMVEISLFLLDQPLRRVNPRTKSDVLRVLRALVPLYHFQDDLDLGERVFQSISSLFSFFKDRASREVLSTVLRLFADSDPALQVVADLCLELNSWSPARVEEADFQRRLKAFEAINETHWATLTARHWTPLIHNMLFYIKDSEEMAIRSSASMSLRRFLEAASAHADDQGFDRLTSSILLPALRRGSREPLELVRAEYIAVMAHAIKCLPTHPTLRDLQGLLVGEDNEAYFFNNILHIQQYQRLRALRRLSEEVQRGGISGENISHFFIPLLEHFIFNRAENESAQNLAGETAMVIGVMMEWVDWSQYKVILRKFVMHFQSKAEPEKILIRLFGHTIDALSRAATSTTSPELSPGESNFTEVPDVPMMEVGESKEEGMRSKLALTIPTGAKLGTELSGSFITTMTKFIHDKDESLLSLRIPIAVTVVKLLKLLPADKLAERLPPVLTDICHILRSRSQESRDMTRRTLTEITTLIGSQCFGFVLKELKGALLRGYQLHVLSFTVHSILVANSELFGPGDLDYCLPQIVSIIMDDIFGVTGQEKDAEDYTSQMKEVRSSKSYDSMELISTLTTLPHLSDLINPIQALLREKLNHNLVRKIDELLRRIGAGLLRNEAIESRTTLVFCYECIQGSTSADAKVVVETPRDLKRKQRYLVSMNGARKGGDRGSTTEYSYKMARFALDLLRMVLRRCPDLQTPSNLAGFIPIINESLEQAQEEVQLSALRLLTTIIKVPLAEIDENTEIYLAQAVAFIRRSVSTNTALSQASLKFIAAILKDRRLAPINEKKLANKLTSLIGRVKADLEEPDLQGLTFNFLRAVMSRQILIPEIYEVMDTVASIMVTNQSRSARNLARGAYFQFVMEYPQGEKRFAKQLGFLVKNLSYQYPEGRQSVLETIHLLMSKIGDKLAPSILSTFFVPLVMLLVNDESQECREMAGILLKHTFSRADPETTSSFLGLLRTWVSQESQALLTRAALQCYIFYLESLSSAAEADAETEIPLLQTQILHLLSLNAENDTFDDWELLYFALQTIHKLCQLFPTRALDASTRPTWTAIEECLSFPHAWVKLSAARLMGLYLADFARTNMETNLVGLPLHNSAKLQLSSPSIIQLTRKSLRMLRVQGISEELAEQNVQNLLFLGRCLAANDLEWVPYRAGDTIPGLIPDATSSPSSSSDTDNDTDTDIDIDTDTDTDVPTSTTTTGVKPPKPALTHIFTTLSHILRRPPRTIQTQSLTPHLSSLTLLTALTTTLPTSCLLPHLSTLLLPLHNLTDRTIPVPHSLMDPVFNEKYKDLQQGAAEVMASLQEKVGTSVYIAGYSKVREGVKQRREGRRGKRARDMMGGEDGEGRIREEARKRRKRVKEKEKRREVGRAKTAWRKQF